MAKTEKISMADLDAMTLAELKSLEKKVAKVVDRFEERERKKALSALKAQARKMGFSLSELTEAEENPRMPGKPRSKVPPKYANPDDKSQTWTGRGRRPAWVNAALDAGKSLDDLAI